MTDDLRPAGPAIPALQPINVVDDSATDAERYPLLNDDGRRLLRRLEDHPAAPPYNYRVGDRLTAGGLHRVEQFAAELETGTAFHGWGPSTPPHWVADFVAHAYRHVPFYRRRGASPQDIAGIPVLRRPDLAAEPWAFVPDDQPLDDLLVYGTSATTGRPIKVLHVPEVPTMYLALLRWALARRGVTLDGGAGKVAIAQVCFQRSTFTFCSISTYLRQAAMVKVNLLQDAWHHHDDRIRFLDDCQAEIATGDPVAFAELMTLPLTWRPKALVSSASTLLPGFRQQLEEHFGCPVLDLYSLTETGPISVTLGGVHTIFPRHLYVEVLDPMGQRCPPGVVGEYTVTGGFNPCLPLIRYATGDYGSLEWVGSQPVLTQMQLRAPTQFRGTGSIPVNNIDVTMAMEPFAVPGFALHQERDGMLRLRLAPHTADEASIRAALFTIFGDGVSLFIEPLDAVPSGRKVVQYSSDMDSASPSGATPDTTSDEGRVG